MTAPCLSPGAGRVRSEKTGRHSRAHTSLSLSLSLSSGRPPFLPFFCSRVCSTLPRMSSQAPATLASRLRAFWNHPAGPQTIHFWVRENPRSPPPSLLPGGARHTPARQHSPSPHPQPARRPPPSSGASRPPTSRTSSEEGGRREGGGVCVGAALSPPTLPSLFISHSILSPPPLSLSAFRRPPETISTPQQCAVSATGLIWSRFSTQITPVRAGRGEKNKRKAFPPLALNPRLRAVLCALSTSSLISFLLSLSPHQVNYNLLTVNVFMAMTGLYQLSRKFGVVGEGAKSAK